MNANMKEKLILKAMPIIIFVCFMQVFSDRMFNIISPNIANTFNLTLSDIGILTTFPSLVFGVGSAIYSVLSDSLSPRKIFTIGIFLFGLGSILTVIFQFSFILIVIARTIQVAGSAVIPGCFVVFVRKYLSPENQGKYLGFNTAMFQLSAALGSIFGGVISHHFSWQLTMILPVIVIFTLTFIRKYLPDDIDNISMTNHKLNIVSTLLLTLAFGLVLTAIKYNTILWYILAILSIVIYTLHSLKIANPILDIRLFKVKKLLSGSLIGAVIYGIQVSFFFVFPFLILKNYDTNTTTVALMFLPANICAFFSGMSSGYIMKKLGVIKSFQLGTFIILLSQIIFGYFLGKDLFFMGIALTLFGIGYTIIYPSFHSALPNALPQEVVGRGMAVYNLFSKLIITIMIALTSILISNDFLAVKIIPNFKNTSQSFIYSNICFIFASVAIISMFLFYLIFKPNSEKNL